MSIAIQTYEFDVHDPERLRALRALAHGEPVTERLPPVTVNFKAWWALLEAFMGEYAEALSEKFDQWKHWQDWSVAQQRDVDLALETKEWTAAALAQWAPWPGNPAQPYPERPYLALPGATNAEVFAYLQRGRKIGPRRAEAIRDLLLYMSQALQGDPSRAFKIRWQDPAVLAKVTNNAMSPDARDVLEMWGWLKTRTSLAQASEGFPTVPKMETHLTIPRYLQDLADVTGAGSSESRKVLRAVAKQAKARIEAGTALSSERGRPTSPARRIELFSSFPGHIQTEILEQGSVLNRLYGANPALLRREHRDDPAAAADGVLYTEQLGTPEILEDALNFVWHGENESSKDEDDQRLVAFIREERKARKSRQTSARGD